jgi:hypothetical protein
MSQTTSRIAALLVTVFVFSPGAVVAQDQCEQSSAFLAWLFGSQLSLATVFYDRDAAAPDEIRTMIDRVRPAAEHLGADIQEWPLKTGQPADDSARILHYLITTTGNTRDVIAAKHGLKCSLLFEVAMSSNTLLLIYEPGGPEGLAIASSIRNHSPLAGIPTELWTPVVEKVGAGVAYSEVRNSIGQFHDRAAKYLNPF